MVSACLGKQISRGTVAGGDACYSGLFQTDRSEGRGQPIFIGVEKGAVLLESNIQILIS